MGKFKEKGLFWPMMVVLLLLSSVATMASFIVASLSDGGALVVDSYYQKAVKWDSLSIVQNRVQDLDWTPMLTMDGTTGTFVLLNNDQKRIPFLSGTISMSRPHTTETRVGLPLRLVQSDSTYVFETGGLRPGLWDFTFSLSTQDESLDVTIRKDLTSDGSN